MVAAQQHDVDHLPRGIRAPVTIRERGSQLVKAPGPGAAAALLDQRDRMLHAAGLAGQQLEIVIKLRAGPELAVQAVMGGDDAAGVVDRDLPRADPRADLQPGAGTGTSSGSGGS